MGPKRAISKASRGIELSIVSLKEMETQTIFGQKSFIDFAL